jgi:competence ComEA-like helix-hairpin-helix protein
MKANSKTRQETRKVDLNTATVEQLKSVRGIGKSRALEIARFRDKHGPFKSLDELGRVPHMGDMPFGELDDVKTHLSLGGADETAPSIVSAQVDINSANVEELRAVEGIGMERAQEIVRYREEHGRITNLDELDTLPHFRDEPEGQRGPIKARLTV